MALETETALAELRFQVSEAADSEKQDSGPILEIMRLSPTQMNSHVIRAFIKQTVHKNVRSKKVSVEFAIDNACFAMTAPETRNDTYIYPVLTFIYEAPTILVRENKDGGKCGPAQGMIHIIGPGKLFIIGQGEVDGVFQLLSHRVDLNAMTLDGRLVSRDEERGLALYSAPHELRSCLKTGVPLDEKRLYSLKGSFVFQTSLISAARSSALYPFDTYQFAGEVTFPFHNTFLKPTIVSDLDAAESLAIRLPREQKAVTISSDDAWHLNLLFGRRTRQFLGAPVALLIASTMIGNSSLSLIVRIIVHSLAFVLFFVATQPVVPGVPFLYPARMVPVCIIVIVLMTAEYFR